MIPFFSTRWPTQYGGKAFRHYVSLVHTRHIACEYSVQVLLLVLADEMCLTGKLPGPAEMKFDVNAGAKPLAAFV